MDIDTSSLTCGILLGALATGLMVAGYYQQQLARNRMKRLDTEKKKAKEALKKASQERQRGCSSLPGALVLIVLGAVVLALALYLLMGGG
jgi:multisubunit Na+/H+ antiporter MnhB subunit